MTNTDSTDNETKKTKALSAMDAVTKLGAALTFCIGMASIFGWIAAKAYYHQFYADWVMTLMPSVVWYGWVVLPSFGLFLGLFVFKAFEEEWNKILRGKLWWVEMVVLLTIYIPTLVVLSFVDLSSHQIHIKFGIFKLLMTLTMVATGFLLISVTKQSSSQHMNLNQLAITKMKRLTYFFVPVIMLVVSLQYGVVMGIDNSNPRLSRLPIVEIDGTEWRLLGADSGHLVVVKLVKDTKPMIQIKRAEDIGVIRPPADL